MLCSCFKCQYRQFRCTEVFLPIAKAKAKGCRVSNDHNCFDHLYKHFIRHYSKATVYTFYFVNMLHARSTKTYVAMYLAILVLVKLREHGEQLSSSLLVIGVILWVGGSHGVDPLLTGGGNSSSLVVQPAATSLNRQQPEFRKDEPSINTAYYEQHQKQ